MSSALIFKVALRAIEGRDAKDATDTMLLIVINSFSIIFIRKTQVYVSLKVTFVVDVWALTHCGYFVFFRRFNMIYLLL